MSIITLRYAIKTTMILFLFMDDYWYYIYHNMTLKLEPQVVFAVIQRAN